LFILFIIGLESIFHPLIELGELVVIRYKHW
jgi:hypothetical protein